MEPKDTAKKTNACGCAFAERWESWENAIRCTHLDDVCPYAKREVDLPAEHASNCPLPAYAATNPMERIDERELERELEDFLEELLCCTELLPSQSRQIHSTMPSPWPWKRALV